MSAQVSFATVLSEEKFRSFPRAAWERTKNALRSQDKKKANQRELSSLLPPTGLKSLINVDAARPTCAPTQRVGARCVVAFAC